MKNKKTWIKYLGLHFIIFLFASFFLSLPFFQSINNLLTDRLQGQIEPRSEIVVVEINDKSLQEIGAWEWSRDKFAKALSNISTGNPSVIGIDVLFLEPRQGDSALSDYLEKTDTKVVFSSKLIDGEVLNPISTFEKASMGYVNFDPDSDGIIRKSNPYTLVDEECEISFSLALIKNYFKLKDTSTLCTNPIQIRKNNYKPSNSELIFNYTKGDFTNISFVDVYNGDFDKDLFKDKIVLIGSTALDLRSNLNDNFTNVFGETIPGVYIHANVVNTFLQNSFLYPANLTISIVTIFLLANVLLIIYKKIKNSFLDFGIFLFTLISLNVAGFVFFEFNIIFPFVLANILISVSYIYAVIFKYYSQSLESAFVKKAFGQYINHELLSQILETPESLKLGGETKKMTVLFSDIRSFTTISEGLTPETLINMLNDYLEFMSGIIISEKGTIDKYIGDAIMAIWNAPVDDSNHEENAVLAGLKMLDSIAKFNEMHKGTYPELKVGVGLNTGEMVVGNVGGEKRFDYTVLGDNVNLASRLEGLTKKYGIGLILTEETKKGVGSDKVIFRFIDEVKVKGKNKPVKIFQPLWNTEANLELSSEFTNGFQAYQKGDFVSALKVFDKLKNSDELSEIYVDRISSLTISQRKDWNGVWTWEDK